METVRWSLVVSKDTDISLRTFLAQQGMRKGDLSRFVEEAVRWRVLDRVTSEVKARNARVPAKKLAEAIDEAIQAVRGESFRRKA
jgi:hypothetical protein